MIALHTPAAGDPIGALTLVLALIIGHMLGDFPLQGQFLALGKERNYWLRNDTPSPPTKSMWLYCLTAHSLIQGGIVWLISGSIILCCLEFVIHWTIDFLKSEGHLSFTSDQILHIGTKVLFVVAIYLGLVS